MSHILRLCERCNPPKKLCPPLQEALPFAGNKTLDKPQTTRALGRREVARPL